MDRPILLQAADAAAVAGVTPAGIGRAARDGRLKVAATTPHGMRLYFLADVKAYAQTRKPRRKSEAA